MGLGAFLFVVFLVLKLTEVIAWSWWLVFLPLIIDVILFLGILTFGVRLFRRYKKHVRDIDERLEKDFRTHFKNRWS